MSGVMSGVKVAVSGGRASQLCEHNNSANIVSRKIINLCIQF